MSAASMSQTWRQAQIIDTHTGGEPTRVVVSGGPDLGSESLQLQRARFRGEFDTFRSAVVNEPRGSDVMVGALLREPQQSHSAAGVIFFNNVGYLQMCGHGTIGVVVALAHLNRIAPGRHTLETPVGDVQVELQGRNRVTLECVPSYRHRAGVTVDVPGIGKVTGDVAWGGNWFFLVYDHDQALHPERVEALTQYASAIRKTLPEQGVTGANGEEIDHIELFGPPANPENHSRNFVLCPGHAFDRSPCGTGTSAKLACLCADGKLKPGETYRQESIIGSVFEGRVRVSGDVIVPIITGTAYVNAETTLLFDPDDPFRFGLRI